MDIFFVLLVKREYLYECTRSLFLAEEMVFMCHIHTPRTPKMIPLYWRVDNTNHNSSNNSKNETFAHFYDELSSNRDEGKEEKRFHFFLRFGLVDIILWLSTVHIEFMLEAFTLALNWISNHWGPFYRVSFRSFFLLLLLSFVSIYLVLLVIYVHPFVCWHQLTQCAYFPFEWTIVVEFCLSHIMYVCT